VAYFFFQKLFGNWQLRIFWRGARYGASNSGPPNVIVCHRTENDPTGRSRLGSFQSRDLLILARFYTGKHPSVVHPISTVKLFIEGSLNGRKPDFRTAAYLSSIGPIFSGVRIYDMTCHDAAATGDQRVRILEMYQHLRAAQVATTRRSTSPG